MTKKKVVKAKRSYMTSEQVVARMRDCMRREANMRQADIAALKSDDKGLTTRAICEVGEIVRGELKSVKSQLQAMEKSIAGLQERVDGLDVSVRQCYRRGRAYETPNNIRIDNLRAELRGLLEVEQRKIDELQKRTNGFGKQAVQPTAAEVRRLEFENKGMHQILSDIKVVVGSIA